MSSNSQSQDDKHVVYGKDNSIILAIARMNPPTPGHLGLIEVLIEQAVLKDIDHVYVSLSKTKDVKNPIFCEMKKTVLGDAERYSDEMTMINSLKKTMMGKTTDPEVIEKIRKMKVHLRCVPEEKGATPFTVVKYIIEEKIKAISEKANSENECPDGINIFLVIGEDRKSMIKDIRKCFASWKHVRPAHGKILERAGMNDLINITECPELLDKLDILDVKQDNWSATVIRNIVKTGIHKEKFLQLYEQYLDTEVASKLYDDIATGLNQKDSPVVPKKRSRSKTDNTTTTTTRKTNRKSGGKRSGGKRSGGRKSRRNKVS